MLFIFVPDFDKVIKSERYKVKTSNKDILKRIDALENLLKKHPVNANRQTGKPMTFKEACAYLGYAPSYLYKLTYKNIIPHHKPTGKMLYFFKDEIDEWIIESNDDTSTSLSAGFRIENPPKGRRTSAELKDETKLEKDPNQVDLFEKGFEEKKGKRNEGKIEGGSSASRSACVKEEVVIEFPLKSRRNK